MSWDDVEFFRESEFTCRCGCGDAAVDFAFLKALDAIRREFQRPMAISSGYRCKNHKIEAAKRVPGAHNTGAAADILVTSGVALSLLRIAAAHPAITGIGVQQKGVASSRFIHLDSVPPGGDLARPNLWSY